MSGSALVDLQYLYYQVQLCVPDTLQQGFDAIKTHLAVAVLVRLLAASRLLRPAIMNIVCTLLGVWLVWYNYGYIVWYCIALAGTSYAMLATGVPFKGPLLGTFAIMYIVSWYVCRCMGGEWAGETVWVWVWERERLRVLYCLVFVCVHSMPYICEVVTYIIYVCSIAWRQVSDSTVVLPTWRWYL